MQHRTKLRQSDAKLHETREPESNLSQLVQISANYHNKALASWSGASGVSHMGGADLCDGGFAVRCTVPGHELQPQRAKEGSLLILRH